LAISENLQCQLLGNLMVADDAGNNCHYLIVDLRHCYLHQDESTYPIDEIIYFKVFAYHPCYASDRNNLRG
jgi:hypothetical protein